MRWLLLLVTSLHLSLPAAETLTVTFTTTAPGGTYSPNNIIAVWVETSSGAFVKTIGDWSNARRANLTQWRAKAGTTDTDAVMGATNSSHASRTVTWNMTSKAAPGVAVANGAYKIWIETVDKNTPTAGVTSVSGANRFSFAFTKDGVAKSSTTVTDPSGKYINISYSYTGVAYGVTYNGNSSTGGTVPTDATAYAVGQTVTVKANSGSLVRTGFSFGGWNTLANGTGTTYAAGTGTFAMGSANVTLYALWTPTYTVTYNGNGKTGGTVPTDATAYTAGQTVTAKANSGTLVKTGSVFGGWNTAADGSGTTYTAGSGTFTMGSANVTLYARWTSAGTVSVIYDANGATGGAVPTDATAYTFGQTVTVKANTGTLVRSGYVFAGWNTAAAGTGTAYAASGSVTFAIAANTTLYAAWTVAPTYTVTYAANAATSGTVPTDATTYSTGQAVTVKANTGTLAKTGAVFGGWNTSADGSGTTYVEGTGTFAMGSANVTLYARWLVPTVTSLAPTGGTTDGGELVTFTGTTLTGTTAVTFGSVAATGVIVVSSTEVTCIAPAATAVGNVAVTLTTPSGTIAGGTYAYVLPSPSITTLIPVEGTTAGGTTVTFTGHHFTGTTSITVGGQAATAIVVTSDQELTCVVPAHAAGVVDVVLTGSQGTVTAVGGYTYSAPISTAYVGFLPSAAGGFYAPKHVLAVWIEAADGAFVKTIGDWSSERRYDLTQWQAKAGTDTDAVMGATRSALTAVTNLTWDLRNHLGHGVADGSYALWIELVDDTAPTVGTTTVAGARRTHLPFTVASHAVVNVAPVDQDGFTALSIRTTAAVVPVPQISSVSPTQGAIAGGTTLTITGLNLSGTTGVTIGGVAATSVTVLSATQVSCVTPAASAGTVAVTVTTDGGSASDATGFTYVSGGSAAYISFIPSAAGGGYAPKHVLAVWVESSAGTYVRTVGDWSDTRRPNLTQWLARSGGDTDAVMGATRAAAAPVNNLTWDLRDRSGALVADGTYRLWIELVDDNSPAAGTTTVVGARRTSLAFTVASHAVTPVGPVDQDGFSSLSIGSQAGAALGNFAASNVVEDQQTARCGGGSVYAVIMGGALLALRRRRSGRG